MRTLLTPSLGILMLLLGGCSNGSSPPTVDEVTERHPTFSIPLGRGNSWSYTGEVPVLRAETPIGTRPTESEIRFIDTLPDDRRSGTYTVYRANIATQIGISYGVAYNPRDQRLVNVTILTEQGHPFIKWHPESFSAPVQPQPGDSLYLNYILYRCTTVTVKGQTYTQAAAYIGIDQGSLEPITSESVLIRPGVGIIQWRYKDNDGEHESNLRSYALS